MNNWGTDEGISRSREAENRARAELYGKIGSAVSVFAFSGMLLAVTEVIFRAIGR